MDINSASIPFHPLMVYSVTAQIIIGLGVFFVASIFESFDKTKVVQSFPKLRIFQLAVTSLTIALSIVHATLLAYPSAFTHSNADPAVACALFTILNWVIVLLPLIDRTGDAAYPHYLAWGIFFIFEALNISILGFTGFRGSGVRYWIDNGVIFARLISVLALLTVTAVCKYIRPKTEEGSAEERTPLLDLEASVVEENSTNKKDSGSDEEEEDEAEKHDQEEEDAWKDDLAELKKRSWNEYIASFKIFLPHLKPRTKSELLCLAIMLACTGLVRVLNVFIPLSLGWVVNHMEGAKALPWKELGLYLGLYLVNSSAGISVVQHLASIRMSMSMRLSLDVFIYNHIMNLDAKFHDSKKTATLGRISDRGDAVIDLFQELFFDFMPTIADLLISMAVLQWLFGAYLCFIVAITGVLFAWSNTHLIKSRTALRRKYIDAWCAVYEHMFETQYNWTTVSHFGRIEHEKDNFKGKNSSKMTKEMALTTYTEVTRCTRQLIMTVGFICATLLAANQIVRGHRKVGDFVMLVTYWSQVMSPVRSIISTITSVSERLVDAEKLMLVLEKDPTVRNIPDAPAFEFKGGSVDFEDVSFSYDGERTVSEGITFHADAGETIALVGETGGGKSTLLKLLFRFYDPSQGRILVDGQDLQTVNMESFRDTIGIVPQDPAMFNRTIFENVRYPNNVATEEEVIEACKAACLHDKIMTFAKQYKEKVGERGTKLSGGECQRLAIARAILKKPKMLLLDEATSAVDSVTESKIQACLRQLCKGRTTFVIAHRLSTILHADKIMVIKGGKLLEVGPHRELIKRKGAYRELWDAQLNLQKQDPGDVGEKDEKDGKDEDSDGEKPATKQSMFYNDMNQEEISEAMLLAALEGTENHEDRPESSRSQKARLVDDDSRTPSAGDFGSEDVTETESLNGREDGKK